MKTCSVRSKRRDQYQSDNRETNDKLNPLYKFPMCSNWHGQLSMVTDIGVIKCLLWIFIMTCEIGPSCALLSFLSVTFRSRLEKIKVPTNQRGEFHISHDASRLISVFSPRWKERSRVSREIFYDLNFKMQLIQGKFQWVLLIFGIWLIM